MKFDPRVFRDIEEAAEFLLDMIANHGWKQWAWSYLREHARCKSGASFPNADAREIYEELRLRKPDLARRIKQAEDASVGQQELL